jgi:hypothetical protein
LENIADMQCHVNNTTLHPEETTQKEDLNHVQTEREITSRWINLTQKWSWKQGKYASGKDTWLGELFIGPHVPFILE